LPFNLLIIWRLEMRRAGTASPESAPSGTADIRQHDRGPKNAQSVKHKVKSAVTAAIATVATAAGVFGPHLGASPNLDIYGGCGLNGVATTSDQVKANPLKNRYSFPGSTDIDSKVDLAVMLKSVKGQLDESKAAEIEGYITEVKPGGIESCNCGATDPTFMDTHIYVNLTPKPDKKSAVIVEVTPRIRQLMLGRADWSSHNLANILPVGTKVRITGWLFYDEEHENAAENIKVRPHNWRGTCWELHPVTGIEMENAEQESVTGPAPGESKPGP
jgi:hypothetical protein